MQNAAQLADRLWKHRSQWLVRFPGMEDVTGVGVEGVERLMVFPGLYRRGGSERNRLKEEKCLVEPVVEVYRLVHGRGRRGEGLGMRVGEWVRGGGVGTRGGGGVGTRGGGRGGRRGWEGQG